MLSPALTMDQCKIGRAALGLSEEELAQAAGVPPASVVAIEAGLPVATGVAVDLMAALAALGVTFHQTAEGRDFMRARTLDGIIEAPVRLSKASD